VGLRTLALLPIENNKVYMPEFVLPAYGLKEETSLLEPFGTGLINSTWKVTTPDTAFILQRVNDAVFLEPESIAHNIRIIAAYLKQHFPSYPFIAPLSSTGGSEMIYVKDKGFYRLFPFVPGSHSKDVVQTPAQAYEAALQFGRFTHLLSGMDASQLKLTIPSFHDLELRYHQFLMALEKGNMERIRNSQELIAQLQSRAFIVDQYKSIRQNPEFKLRVTHHDTKISNVLFDKDDKGICVIDLDTVMPGYFISDVGDMMRTYLSPVNEEETDLSKIEVRDDFYKAIVQGYYQEMKAELTGTEKEYFFYAGEFMIYMQALRFLTDHLNNDIYYGAKYLDHNYYRALNQATLLDALIKKQPQLENLSL
jgi:Ser/Thr protein kinase RdoA (MazF antagonist)